MGKEAFATNALQDGSGGSGGAAESYVGNVVEVNNSEDGFR